MHALTRRRARSALSPSRWLTCTARAASTTTARRAIRRCTWWQLGIRLLTASCRSHGVALLLPMRSAPGATACTAAGMYAAAGMAAALQLSLCQSHSPVSCTPHHRTAGGATSRLPSTADPPAWTCAAQTQVLPWSVRACCCCAHCCFALAAASSAAAASAHAARGSYCMLCPHYELLQSARRRCRGAWWSAWRMRRTATGELPSALLSVWVGRIRCQHSGTAGHGA